MLPKQKRLNLKDGFRWVAEGKVVKTKNLVVLYRAGENKEPKVGITAPKKSFKKSTARNKAKRLVSKVLEATYNNLQGNINLVIIPKGSILNINKEDISRELKNVKDIFKAD